MPVTINGQLAQVGYSGNEELTLNCRYPSINISLSVVSDKLESILRKYGVSHLVNFWCEEVLLVHTTFSSEHGLRRLLRLKEKAQDEVASLLSAEMMVYTQNRKSDTTTAPLPSLPTAVEMRVFLVQPDIVKNTAQVEPVSLENHSACMALWKESEMFDFSSLFRAYRVNPSSLPDQGAVTLKVLVSELHEVVSWFGLGLQLGVPDTELLKLRHKYAICREVDECKTEVFICWMKQMKPTWSAVVRALMGIKMFSLAHKIALKYGVPVATSVETKALQAAAFSNEKEDSRKQQIEQIEKGLEAKEKQAEERRQRLVKAQRERAILKQRFAQARKNALDVHAKATRLVDQRKKIEGQLELKQYELELLRSAEKDKQKLQKIIDSKDIEIKHLQEQLQVINAELEVTRKEGYDYREQLQQVTKELEVKSAEVRLIERSRMELRADLDAERKRVDMLLMQRSASASGDKSTIEMELQNQIAALKEESESKSRIMEASISQKDAEIEKLSVHLKMIEKQLQSLLLVQQTPHPSQSEHEAELQTLVLETSELRAKLVEAEDDKQEAVRQLEIAQEQLKGYLKNEALAPPYSDSDSSMAIVPEEAATYTGVPNQPTGDEDDAKDEEKHIMEFEDEGLTAVTVYDYEAEADDEISFDEGELITNIDQIDEGWWRGRRDLDGSYGLFPSNYVELCSPEELQKFKAKQSKRHAEQQHHEQLQHLIQLQRDGQLDPDKGKTAKTLRDYKAVAVDEISFLSGEIITNIESTVYVGLLKGTRLLDGSRGFFPESCVTID